MSEPMTSREARILMERAVEQLRELEQAEGGPARDDFNKAQHAREALLAETNQKMAELDEAQRSALARLRAVNLLRIPLEVQVRDARFTLGGRMVLS